MLERELTHFTKDPNSVLDYVWNWTAWLDGDTIASHTITATGGLIVDSSTVDGPLVTVWLSGGTLGETSKVTCHIVTDGGRTEEKTSTFQITDR